MSYSSINRVNFSTRHLLVIIINCIDLIKCNKFLLSVLPLHFAYFYVL